MTSRGVLIVRLLAVASALAAAAGCQAVHERVHMSQGNRLSNAQRFDEAIVEYEGAVEVAPSAFEPCYRLAMAHLALYHPGSAVPQDRAHAAAARAGLERCSTLPAPDAAAHRRVEDHLVSLLMALEEWDAAVARMERRLEAEPENLDLVDKLAGVHSRRGDFPAALRWLERRTALDPSSAPTWHTIAVLCWDRSYRGGILVGTAEREELVRTGLAALDRALALRPDWPDSLVYYNLLLRERAKVYQARGEPREAARDTARAEEYLQRALALRGKAGARPT